MPIPDSLWVIKLPGLASGETVTLSSVLGELCRVFYDARPSLDVESEESNVEGTPGADDEDADENAPTWYGLAERYTEILRNVLVGRLSNKTRVESAVSDPQDSAFLRLLEKELPGCPVVVTPAAVEGESGVPTSLTSVRLFSHSCIQGQHKWFSILEGVWPRVKVCTCARMECELHTHLPSGETALAVAEVAVGPSVWQATPMDVHVSTRVAEELLRRVARNLNRDRAEVATDALSAHLPRGVIDHVLHMVEPRAFVSAIGSGAEWREGE
jgi:hypothetical protein